ncbi:MAG: helix-turn-helix transcriptional regulator [Clostridiales bacterium]|nr:helix-turn-helix transcriptional regulator [Clostridiales bacterium]
MKKKTIDHTELLVLSLLAGEDMYGYQIITELARRSDHTFDMKEGTLYPVLHALWKEGTVECYEAEAPTGRKRKYYHLTRRGREALKTETEEWQRYAHGMNAVLSFVPAMG